MPARAPVLTDRLPDDMPTIAAGTLLSRVETLFLGFAFLVLQGAFLDMAASDGAIDAATAESGTLSHQLGFALVLFGTGLFGLRRAGRIGLAARANLAYFVLPAVILASVLWSIEPLLTLKRSLLTMGVCAFDLYVAAAIGLDRVLKLLSASIFVSALASVLVALALPTIGREITEGLIGDWRGVFAQKNALGHVMSIGVTVELALMLRARRPMLLGIARLALYALLVVMAHSTSSLLAVLFAVLLSAVYAASRRGAGTLVLCTAFGLAPVVLAGSVILTDPAALFELIGRDESLTGRTELWSYVLDMIAERPLTGWGYMAFWAPDSPAATYISSQVRWQVPNAHDGYLELLLGTGLLGLAGFVVTGFWTLRRVVGSFLVKNEIGALLLIVSGQLLVANLTESYMIGASVLGWNVFSILGLKAGLALRQSGLPALQAAAPARDRRPRLA